ncbi:DUF1294 domain-containing protein [Rhodobacter sp. KR11]|uniref:DUF1294 domain-containing protein n=1 Tax=Rhodobacter sp. KR11 TaxID=2974588 RepID=UPI0022222955|nr:DUF1294 domain-containing protein [Rhodobacter sp. KR11]MCW1918807.1 DUF1294 domain-containing protein [Rhodobacter sp. KR11]
MSLTHSLSVTALAAIWLLAINLLTYITFYTDKQRALAKMWRIPESRLLLLAMLGGWPAAKAAQTRFRHKTRKEPFRTQLNLAILPAPIIIVLAVFAPDDQSGRWDRMIHGPDQSVTDDTTTLPRKFGPGGNSEAWISR